MSWITTSSPVVWPSVSEASARSHMAYRKIDVKPRVVFDPTNQEHLVDFAHFVKYNKWVGSCSYYLEDPFGDIPTMIRSKIAEQHIRKLLESI